MCVSPPPPRGKKAGRPDPCRVCGAPSWWNGGRVVAEVRHDLEQGARRVIDVLRLLDHLGDVLLRRGLPLPGRGPGLLRILTAQLGGFGDVC